MNRVTILLFTFLLSASNLFGDERQGWAVSLIPSELEKKANAVVRLHETTLKVFDNGNAEETSRVVITILNENGQRFKHFVEHYNKYSSISGIKGTIYDKNGKKVQSIKPREIMDISAIAGFSLYDDSRVKVISPKYGDYPYTVEYSYTKKLSSFFMLPGWQVYPGYDVSVQKSVYNLSLSPKAKVKYKGNDSFNIEPTTTTDGKGFTTKTWVAAGSPAIEQEPFAGYLHEDTPLLMVAPMEFTMDGYTGSNASWQELGDWAFRLGQGRNVVSKETQDKVLELIANLDSDIDKARAIYEYMQGKVRYVNIAIGIGGWQPFPAETVEKFWYGDCKALSNYMMTLLEVANIKSHYCLVRAGDDMPNIDKDFVSSQFNHAFLMIPYQGDTIYLECTSQQVPFGYNGTFTDDRHILVIDKDSSYLTRTNVYSRDQNKTENSYIFRLKSNNEATISAEVKYIGVATETPRFMMTQKPERQREYVNRRLQLNQVKINSLSYSERREIVPEITELIEMTVPQLGQVTASKSLVIPFNQVTLQSDLKRLSNRRTSIVIRRDQQQVDILRYELPSGYTIDQLPNPSSFASEFGSYNLTVNVEGNIITFKRILEWNKGKYRPERYNDLMLFQRKVNESDRQVIMLKPL